MEVSDTKFVPVANYIAGQPVLHEGRRMDVENPLDGTVISSVPLSGAEALNAAVEGAKAAFYEWSNLTIKERVQPFFRFRSLLDISVHDSIRRERIQRACRLLKKTDMLIEVLSEACGYATRERFNQAFKQETGSKPSEYRRKFRFSV